MTMVREYPPKPSFDDALDIDTAREHVHRMSDHVQDTDPMVDILRYELPLLVSRIEQYPNYAICEQHRLEPPTRETKTPDGGVELEFPEHGTGVPVSVPTTNRIAMSPEELIGQHAEQIEQQQKQQLYEQPARRLLDVLENGYIDRPITREVVEAVSNDAMVPEPYINGEPPEQDFETRTKTVAAGHERLYVIGVELGADIYHQTERQAVEEYYDRCERVTDRRMVAKDFEPYIIDPPTHVQRYPEESRVPAYGDPVDWDAMTEDIGIVSVRDLEKSEREELSTAISEKWPEEALI